MWAAEEWPRRSTPRHMLVGPLLWWYNDRSRVVFSKNRGTGLCSNWSRFSWSLFLLDLGRVDVCMFSHVGPF